MSTGVAADTAVIKALKKMRLPQTQRNREFWLLLFACALSGAALTKRSVTATEPGVSASRPRIDRPPMAVRTTAAAVIRSADSWNASGNACANGRPTTSRP